MDEEHADALIDSITQSKPWFAVVDNRADTDKDAEAALVHMAGVDLWKYFD